MKNSVKNNFQIIAMAFRLSHFCYLLIIFVISCQPKERQVVPAFYHWKTTFNITTLEQDLLQQLGAKNIYAKFFDVDWKDNAPAPTAEIIIHPTTLPDSTSIIPTIYITNQTFVNLPEQKIDDLAENIIRKINTLAAQIPNYQLTEIQFDCDWTIRTRDKYFQFLKKIRTTAVKHIQLSATIRLHQIKYADKTGIPPIDRGVLMFYNTGDLKNWKSHNTILEIAEAKKYIDRLPTYRLPLDIALPIFNWGVVYRDERLFKLINGLGVASLMDTTRFTKIDVQRYEVIKSTYLGGHYLYRNDKIRLEKINPMVLQTASTLLAPLVNNDDFQLLFYHLDSTNITRHPYTELYEIQQRFIKN